MEYEMNALFKPGLSASPCYKCEREWKSIRCHTEGVCKDYAEYRAKVEESKRRRKNG